MQPDRAAPAVLSRVVDDIRQFPRCYKPDSRWQWAEWFTYAGSVTAERRPFDEDCLVTAQAGAWRWSLRRDAELLAWVDQRLQRRTIGTSANAHFGSRRIRSRRAPSSPPWPAPQPHHPKAQ